MSKKKPDVYRVERFSAESLQTMQDNLLVDAAAIGGLPKSPEEALQKRGWLLPYLLAYDSLLWNRWSYWTDILAADTIEGSGPIPKIEWSSMGYDRDTCIISTRV
jgi:hypothetical protein